MAKPNKNKQNNNVSSSSVNDDENSVLSDQSEVMGDNTDTPNGIEDKEIEKEKVDAVQDTVDTTTIVVPEGTSDIPVVSSSTLSVTSTITNQPKPPQENLTIGNVGSISNSKYKFELNVKSDTSRHVSIQNVFSKLESYKIKGTPSLLQLILASGFNSNKTVYNNKAIGVCITRL